MTFEKLRNAERREMEEEQQRKEIKRVLNQKKERKKEKKKKLLLRTKVKEFNTICLEKIEKYEKNKRSLKCILIKLACVVNAYVEIYYRLILSTFLD